MIATAKFRIGQLVRHQLFNYRGVIVDVDPSYQGSEECYENIEATKPPKDQPWYYLMIDGSLQTTYVSEKNLHVDMDKTPIKHPELDQWFERFFDKREILCQTGSFFRQLQNFAWFQDTFPTIEPQHFFDRLEKMRRFGDFYDDVAYLSPNVHFCTRDGYKSQGTREIHMSTTSELISVPTLMINS